ncbi:MAG: sigma-E processing peptidase SpoIIGA [Clostridia bacterium]|nr:sigma-E processing peptidase SpoIIGA [Clostridia bacterium]
MIQDVYVDLYFLINVSMNLLCLMITASLLHLRVKRWRAIVAASLGALYAVAALILGAGGILGFLADLAIAILMCTVTFTVRPLSFFHLLKCTAVQMLTSMLLGGIMTALYSLLNRIDLPLDSLEGDGLSVWSFAILSAIAALMTARGGRFLGRSAKTRCITVHATLFGKQITLRALVDTGNLLREPVSGKGVIVADRKTLLAALPRDVAQVLSASDPAVWLSDPAVAHRVRVIPIRTASGESLLPAILPETLHLTEGKTVLPTDHLIAPAELAASADGFDAVIGAE